MDMSKAQVIDELNGILEEIYQNAKLAGKIDQKAAGFCNGYVRATKQFGIINDDEWGTMIKTMKQKVFGRSDIKVIDYIKDISAVASDESIIDKPTFLRNGRQDLLIFS